VKSLLTVEHLSTCLQKSVASIRSDATRNPRSLPPLCRLPGTKRLLWRAEDVERWLAIYATPMPAEQTSTPPTPTLTRGRGRPTKAEQIERERQESNKRDAERSNELARD
jgi:hypothetical protein